MIHTNRLTYKLEICEPDGIHSEHTVTWMDGFIGIDTERHDGPMVAVERLPKHWTLA